jgi:uncharacterized protein
VPSRVTWNQGLSRCTLLQETSYPAENLITFTFTASRPVEFTVNVRIPAWAGKATSVWVNGSRVRSEAVPGTFHPVHRTWKSGDKIEFEIAQPVRLKAVDAQNPDQVALLRGPQVLFAIVEAQPRLLRKQLAAAKIDKSQGNDWMARTEAGDIRLRPFESIGDEVYQTYFQVAG